MKFILFFLLLTIQVYSQNLNRSKDTITYREYNKLQWQDFKASPPENTLFTASVSTGMSYKWSYSTSKGIPDFDYEVQAKLYRNFSWSNYKTEKEQVLKHEQLHFDITELYVRKFRKALSEYIVGRSIRNDIARIYNDLEAERNGMQLLYDAETNHSLIKDKQLEWELRIRRLLTELEVYK